MIDFTVRAEDSDTLKTLELFFDNYKDTVAQFSNNVLKSQEGIDQDCMVLKAPDGVYELYRTPPDKGFVIVPTNTENPATVAVTPYTTLPIGERYIVADGKAMTLFVKEAEGVRDLKVGHFINLNQMIADLNGTDVEQGIQTAKAHRDAAKKVEEDIERKAKLRALAKNESPEPEPATMTVESNV